LIWELDVVGGIRHIVGAISISNAALLVVTRVESLAFGQS